MKKRIAAITLAAGLLVGTATAVSAGAPEPGDKQCVPGQQGNPHPGFKAGACDNP